MTNRTQTRGFLFADLRGYSEFTDRHGDAAARELIAAYRSIVRTAIAEHRGAEIRTEGDSFYIVFDSVADAVLCGLDILAACAGASTSQRPIRVGIGVHAGETVDTDEGIVSGAVNIAARICSAAGPGEMLVSDTVRALTRSSFDVAFVARGRRRLKGIAEPIVVYRVTRSAPEPPRRFLTRPVVAVVVGIVVLAAVTGTALLADRWSEVGQGRTPTPTSSDAASSVAPSFPDAAEATLLNRLPEQVAVSCERADIEDAPVYEDVAFLRVGEFPLSVVAGLSCISGQTRVHYWQAASAADVDAIFAQEVGRLGLPAGECGPQSRVWQSWELGANRGKVLCYAASASRLMWTFGDVPLLVSATRRDGDFDALLEWWRDVGRLLSR